MEVMTQPAQSHLAQQINLIWHPHPVSLVAGRTQMICAAKPGSTVKDIALAAGIDPHQPIVISLDDRLLRPEEWDTVCPESNQILNIHATVQGGGGGGGSNAGMIVAMIAVVVIAIAAPYMAPAAWGLVGATGSVTMAGAMVTGAIMVAGSMMVNAMFAASTPSTDLSQSSGQYGQPSATYSLAGGSNRMRPYESMAVVMGAHRFFPDLAAKPFTEYHGEDQYLYQIFHLGLSTTDLSDWKIGTTSIDSYKDYSWHVIDQNGRINAFPGNVDSASGGDLVNSAGWITRTTSANTYRIGLDIEGSLYYANNSGGLDATSVQIRVQYKPAGSSAWLTPSAILTSGPGFVAGSYWTRDVWVESGRWEGDENGSWWVDTSHYESRTDWVPGAGDIVIISGNSQAPRRSTLFIDVPVGTYDVRVIRDTSDSSDARLQNKTNWSTLRSYQQDTGTYIGQNRQGLIIRASEQLNGVIQQLNVYAEAYANYWNGSAWAWGKTSNPAHWFTDFSVGRRNTVGKLIYGLGLPKSQIDVDALHAWASFCTNEGLTFNAVLDDNKTAADILTAIARCGFASPSWGSGKLGVVWDSRNATAVGAYGMSNIIKGSFEVSYITEQLAEEIIVRFMNPAKDWTQDEVRTLVPGVTSATRTSTIDLFGCTSVSMAGKFANYLAAQQKYRKRRISWDADFEGLTCQRGDVVILSHDLTQWGYSGRVVSVDGTTMTLDRLVPRSGNTEYLMLKRPDGTLITYTVAAATGDSDTIILSAAPNMQNGRKDMDHMWFFSPLATPGKRVKILSVQPISDSRVRITATDEDPEFYAAWDGSWQESPSKTLLLNNKPVVSAISVTENIYLGQTGGIQSHVGVQWLASGTYERAKLRYQIGTGGWKSAETFGTSHRFDTDQVGTIQVEITPVYGAMVGQTASYTGYLYGVMASPASITGLTSFYRDGRNVLSWNPVSDPRTIDYEVRKGPTWNSAVVQGAVTNTEYITDGNGTYWIATHFRTGTGVNAYSDSPVSITISGATLVRNVIATFDEVATHWSGTMTNMAVTGDEIYLEASGNVLTASDFLGISDLFWYGGVSPFGIYELPAAHAVDIGREAGCQITFSYAARGQSIYDNVLTISDFLGVTDLFGATLGPNIGIQPQIAMAGSDGVYGTWQNYQPGIYYAKKFKGRVLVTTSASQTIAILSGLTFSVDVPDRLDQYQVTTNTSADTELIYSAPFNGGPNELDIPLLQATIVGAQQGDDIQITNQTDTGCTVAVINAGARVVRTVNVQAQGY